MIFIILTWSLVWGGMFSGPHEIRVGSIFPNPVSFVTGLRPLFPIMALYFCSLWVLATRSKWLTKPRSPMAFLVYYGLIGLLSSVFLSPNPLVAIYWALNYLSCFLVFSVIQEWDNFWFNLRAVFWVNYLITLFLLFSILPDALRLGISNPPPGQVYRLPLNLGNILVNGAGRFAAVAIIVSLVRFSTPGAKRKMFWLPVGIPAVFIVLQTESRTALLGLAICGLLFIILKGLDLKYLIIVLPVNAYGFWLSAYKWRARGSIENLIALTGRQNTWKRGLELFKHSPFFGSGFHADRLMLKFEHMHNSYFHALVQSGIFGAVCFLAALIGIWTFIIKSGLIRRVRRIEGPDQPFLMESVLILTFLTARSLFESTAAFYGVDLLLLIPALCYVYAWIQENPKL